MDNNKIGVIGLGNMATAILKATLSTTVFDRSNIVFYDIDIAKEGVAQQLGIVSAKSVQDIADSCKYVFLAVKPKAIGKVLYDIKDHINSDTVIVSIVAGISSRDINTYLGKEHKVIRAMPNTPIMVGSGVTALCKNSLVTDEEFDYISQMFSCGSIIETIPETKMNEIVAVHGSTPAYIILIAKYFCEFASEQGIPLDTANKLFCETLIGSAKLMTQTGLSHQELIDMVATPNGTTEKGIDTLQSWAIQGAIFECCENTVKRAYEISEEQAIQ